MIVH
jgi:hypothetical protein